MKALGLVVSEKEFFFYVFPIVCLWELMTPGAIFDSKGMVGRIYKEDHYTLLHTKYESSFKIFLCFSHDTPGVGPIWTTGARLAGNTKRTIIHCY